MSATRQTITMASYIFVCLRPREQKATMSALLEFVDKSCSMDTSFQPGDSVPLVSSRSGGLFIGPIGRNCRSSMAVTRRSVVEAADAVAQPPAEMRRNRTGCCMLGNSSKQRERFEIKIKTRWHRFLNRNITLVSVIRQRTVSKNVLNTLNISTTLFSCSWIILLLWRSEGWSRMVYRSTTSSRVKHRHDPHSRQRWPFLCGCWSPTMNWTLPREWLTLTSMHCATSVFAVMSRQGQWRGWRCVLLMQTCILINRSRLRKQIFQRQQTTTVPLAIYRIVLIITFVGVEYCVHFNIFWKRRHLCFQKYICWRWCNTVITGSFAGSGSMISYSEVCTCGASRMNVSLKGAAKC